MLKRPPLIAVLAAVLGASLVAPAALAGPMVVGPNGNTQSIDVRVKPRKLPRSGLAPATLEVTTKTTSTTDPSGVPIPARRAVVDFDRSISLFTNGLPTCDPGRLQSVSTEQARSVCRRAQIGTGHATVLLPLAGKVFVEPAVVTAFHGPRVNGNPTVLLHAYGVAPVQTTLVLSGPVTRFGRQGIGWRIDLDIPRIAGGVGALTDFHVKINRRWRFKRRQRSFISAGCPSSKRMRSRGTFTFADGEALTAISVRGCAQRR